MSNTQDIQLVTAASLAAALGLKSAQGAQRYLVGLEPAVVLGKSKGYSLSDVQDHVWDMYAPILTFLGLSRPSRDTEGSDLPSEL